MYAQCVGEGTVPTKGPKSGKKAATGGRLKQPAFRSVRPQTGVQVRKEKPMTITDVGKNAKSRLFDYKANHDEKRARNLE